MIVQKMARNYNYAFPAFTSLIQLYSPGEKAIVNYIWVAPTGRETIIPLGVSICLQLEIGRDVSPKE